MKMNQNRVFATSLQRLVKTIMRAFVLLFVSSALALSPKTGLSQHADIFIDSDKTISLEQIFKVIQNQTDYEFVYSSALIEQAPRVTVKKGIVKANILLKKGLDPIFCTYDFIDNTVVVKKKMHPTLGVPLQEVFTITGKVSDKEGVPVPGATVYVTSREPLPSVARDTDFVVRGTATDFDGNFTIEATLNHYLAVRALGFEFNYQQLTTQQAYYEIILEESASQLEEVVVVGFGTTVRKDLTGSVASVKTEAIKQIKTQTVDQALVGQVAGVFVESNAGAPGTGASINIRGLSQINGDNQPLYVIDGVPVIVNTNFGNFAGPVNRQNPLIGIDPSNIERIDVLKDASSAAIYGSRAANGVVIITTKRGQLNRAPQFNFSYSLSTMRPTRTFDFLNAAEYRQFTTELAPTLRPFTPGVFDILNNPDDFYGDADTDWQDLIIDGTPFWKQYNFNVSGGTSKSTYALAASFNDQDGLLINNNLKRYNINMNIDSQVTDFLKVGASLNYTYAVNKRSLIDNLILGRFRPDLAPFDENGNPAQTDIFGRIFIQPVENQGRVRNRSISQNLLGSLYGEVSLIKNLKFRSQINVGLTNDKNSIFAPSFTTEAQRTALQQGTQGATLQNETSDGFTTSFVNRFEYQGTIGNKHNINATAGFSWDRNFLNSESQDYDQFPDDDLLTNIQSAGDVFAFSSLTQESGLNSLFGRVNYNYADRYLVTFTARYDGSTKFGPENRWGFFPSLGLGWNIHNEAFFGENNPFSQLKLRASLGRTGNDNLPSFSFLPFYEPLGPQLFYGGLNGIRVSNLPNPGIRWESTDQLDLGIEFGLFNGRINGEVVYFEKNTSDLLLFTPVPSETGTSQFTSNVADVSNTGWEFTLGADVIRNNNFRWNSSFNISFVDNNVDRLNGGFNEDNPFLDPLFGIIEGQPIGIHRGFEVVSIAQDQAEIDALNTQAGGQYSSVLLEPGDYIYRDVSGDGRIDDEDIVTLGDINPDYFGGWINTITYKDFDFSFNIQFVQGNDRRWTQISNLDNIGTVLDNQLSIVLDTWSANNPDANFARVNSRSHSPGSGFATSKNVVDGSYTRLRYATLGYNFPQSILEKIGLRGARIYVSGNNLFTISDYPGLDPESVNTGAGGTTIARRDDRGFNYPQAKTFTLGIDFNF